MKPSAYRAAVIAGTAVKLAYVGNSVGLASGTNCLGVTGPAGRGTPPPDYLDAYLKTFNAASAVRNYSRGGATLRTVDAGYIHADQGTLADADSNGVTLVMFACAINEALTDGYSTAQYATDIAWMVDDATARGMDSVMVLESYVEELPGYSGHDYESFIRQARTTAETLGLEVVDLYGPTWQAVDAAGGVAVDSGLYVDEGTEVHMNPTGSALLGANLVAWTKYPPLAALRGGE